MSGMLLLIATACAGTPAVPEPSPVGSPAPTSPPVTSEAPEPAEVLRFQAPNLAGGVLRGTDYAGKDVAMWFWAPW